VRPGSAKATAGLEARRNSRCVLDVSFLDLFIGKCLMERREKPKGRPTVIRAQPPDWSCRHYYPQRSVNVLSQRILLGSGVDSLDGTYDLFVLESSRYGRRVFRKIGGGITGWYLSEDIPYIPV
jgi:hypothetical protein